MPNLSRAAVASSPVDKLCPRHNQPLARLAFTIAASANGINPALLAAVGEYETGFQDNYQTGGQGVGYFQIDLGKHPDVSPAEALDLAWSANYAAGILASGMDWYLSQGVIDSLAQAGGALRAYNHGYGKGHIDEDTLHIGLPSKFILDGMGLRWNGDEGHFFDESGRLIAFDPSVKSEGPSVLLIREEDFLKFLSKADCDFFWMLLGEKQMIGGHTLPEEWKGRLEISGAFRRSKSGAEGQISAKHRSR